MGGTQECDQSVVTSTEAKLKEKQAMVLVSGLQADIEALQAQVRIIHTYDVRTYVRETGRRIIFLPQRYRLNLAVCQA